MTGVQTGWNAALAAYNPRSLVPVEQYGFDTFESRLSRYATYESYLNNTVYSHINAQSSQHKLLLKLYPNVRAIYNPVKRQNDLLTSYVYGGNLDMEHLKNGAIPIVSKDTAIIDAIRNIFVWSRWGENKSLFVSQGANLGDVFLKVCDDRLKQKTRLEVIHPARVRQIETDSVGNITSAIIQYMRYDEPDLSLQNPGHNGYNAVTSLLQWYTYTEVITKDKFSTYKNGELYPFYMDMNGQPVKEWDNEYGFVPMVMANHNITGLKFGTNAYYNSTRKIDEVNDAASLLDDQIRKIVIPLLAAINVKKKEDVTVDASDKDKFVMLYMPEGSDIKPVVSPIDIAGVGGNIDKILAEIERDLPELALQTIRTHGQLTAPGVETAYADAIARIKQARGQYDAALVRALKMAISIGGYNAYEGFAGFSLDSYDKGDLDFAIKDRQVINDTLSLSEKLTAFTSVNSLNPALQKLALTEMGYDETQIDDVTQATIEAQANAVKAFAQGLGNGGSTGKGKPKQLGAGKEKPKQLALPQGA